MIRNLNRHQRRRRRLHRKKSARRPFVLEAIEPRILLSADPTHFLGLLSDADGNDMLLQGSPGDRFGQGTLTLLDNAGAPVWTDPLRGVDEDAAFGWAVLNAGDMNGDNVEDFFVSAPGEGAGKGERGESSIRARISAIAVK